MSLFPTEMDKLESKIFLLESENEMLRNTILKLSREKTMSEKSEFPVTEICKKCPHLEVCTTSEVDDETVEEFFKVKED